VGRYSNLMHEGLDELDRSHASRRKGSNLPLLLDNLQARKARARILAIREISDLADAVVIDRLLDMAQRDPEESVRCAAISGLGKFIRMGVSSACDPETDREFACLEDGVSDEDFERVYDFLVAVCQDQDRSLEEKRHAVESMSFFSNETVETLIADLYNQPQKSAKRSALIAMGNNGSMRWVDVLARDLYNGDRDLQLEAVTAAGEMALESLGKDLWRLTFSEDKDLLLTALWSLGQTGWDGAFERLDELTLHWDPEIREAADAAMEEWLFYNGLSSDLEEDGDSGSL
jgi:HEAT repeat protein